MTTENNASPPPPPPPPPASPAPQAGAEWLEKMPEAYREHITKNGYTTEDKDTLLETLLISDIGALKKLGRPASDLIIKPAGEFGENKDAYISAMRQFGAPEDGKGYGDAPALDGLQFKDGMWDKFAETLASNGVPKFLVEPVLQGMSEMIKEQVAAGAGPQKTPQELAAEHTDALVGEVGEAKATALTADARAFLAAKGEAGFMSYLDETGLGNDPRATKFLAGLMKDYKEAGITLEAGNTNQQSGMNAAQAKAKLAQLEGDPNFKAQLTDRNNANHKWAVEERVRLMGIAEGAST